MVMPSSSTGFLFPPLSLCFPVRHLFFGFFLCFSPPRPFISVLHFVLLCIMPSLFSFSLVLFHSSPFSSPFSVLSPPIFFLLPPGSSLFFFTFSPPLFSPFSFCPCSLLLFFFLLSRSPHCLVFFFFSVFLPPFFHRLSLAFISQRMLCGAAFGLVMACRGIVAVKHSP